MGDRRRQRPLPAVHVGKTLLERLQRIEFVRKGFRTRQTAAPLVAAPDERNLLNALVLDQPMDKKKDYEAQLEKLQGRLALAVRTRSSRAQPGAGLRGHGRRRQGGRSAVTAALDTRQYHVIPIAAPSDEERAQPYLWRFWRRLPRQGKVAIFDRSWYGRVLVERVEGFCSEADWMRAYAEINDFEDRWVSAGAIVVKFWLSVSDEEQLRRFKAREEAPSSVTRSPRKTGATARSGPLRTGGVRHDRPHQHRKCRLDPRRGRQQILCAGKDSACPGR